MADIVDIANDLRDAEIEAAIASRAAVVPVTGTGKCLHCDSVVRTPQQRWCDADCRDDYEKAQRAVAHRPVEGE